MGWPWGTGQVQLRSWTWTWTWSCGLGVLLDEVAKRAPALKSRKRKRVSLTTMPMQSKAQQQHMNEKKDAMQRNESAAATILTKNEARSKRYYARIEAGARELRRAEKEKEAAREVVDAGGGRAAEALEAARVVGSDSCAIVFE
mgnify:CR=1 FL=1